MSGTMLEIRIHGRGGQGAQVACQILAGALFRGGRHVQAFAAYGGERRGAPVTAFVRAADRPIRQRCDIERPQHLLVLDATMLGERGVAADMRPGGSVVVNAAAPPGAGSVPDGVRLVAVDAGRIAREAGLGGIVSTAMVGAFAGATGIVTLEALTAAVEELSPGRKQENAAACAAAHREAAALLAAGV
jgi:2-oxoacid:acceptor oxidoreductase gamma subunit (pyruvate/2-ketoisovalerate family)